MKSLKHAALILTAVTFIFCANNAVAQNAHNQDKNHEKHAPSKQNHNAKMSHEKIKSLKVAFLTDKLSLTPEEAEKFWPVYNSCEKDAFEARKETMKAQKALRDAVKAEGEKKSDKVIKELADAYYAAIDKENVVAKANFAKYQKVLPIEKAAMVRVIEEQFLHSLVGQMKRGPQQPQKPRMKNGPAPQAAPKK